MSVARMTPIPKIFADFIEDYLVGMLSSCLKLRVEKARGKERDEGLSASVVELQKRIQNLTREIKSLEKVRRQVRETCMAQQRESERLGEALRAEGHAEPPARCSERSGKERQAQEDQISAGGAGGSDQRRRISTGGSD